MGKDTNIHTIAFAYPALLTSKLCVNRLDFGTILTGSICCAEQGDFALMHLQETLSQCVMPMKWTTGLERVHVKVFRVKELPLPQTALTQLL